MLLCRTQKKRYELRLAIEDVVGEYVQLKRAGRNFKGLSPFTDRKDAKLYREPRKGNLARLFSSW